MLHETTILYRWKEKEFEKGVRTKQWYIFFSIVFLLLIGVALFFKNYLLAILIFIAGFILWFSENENETQFVEISKRGIRIDDEYIPYEKIHAFWITKNEIGKPILILKVERNLHPIETLAIGKNINLEELRNVLLEYIEEKEMDEPSSNKLVHYFNL